MNDIDISPPARHRVSMTDQEEKERRASIQAIMKDPFLSPHERRKSIQSLMDGRRRSSVMNSGSNVENKRVSLESDMAIAASCVASSFEDDDVSRASKKRSSPNLNDPESPQDQGNDQQFKRHTSLHESFTIGFSTMGVKGIDADTDSACASSVADPTAMARRMEKSRPPCGHYQRNCSIVSPCCGLVFGCRICHNDATDLPPPFLIASGDPTQPSDPDDACLVGADPDLPVTTACAHPATKSSSMVPHRRSSALSSSDSESHHEINRFAIKEVICRECFTRQSSKTNNCVNCGVEFGEYHCSTCNLWMSNSEEPYHCEQCGFCRVGGRENFTHCDNCGMCIDALLFEEHNCKFGKYMSNCPVCQEDLFSSRMASHEMPCGHAIHWHCFRELTSYDIRCPVCKKTAETPDQMEDMWSTMAVEVALQPVPAELARVVDILCNDCDEKSINQRWHFLGVQCQMCSSFNTVIERTIFSGQEAHDFLGPPSNIAGRARSMSGMMDQRTRAEHDRDGTVRSRENINPGELSDQMVGAEVMDILQGTSSRDDVEDHNNPRIR